MERLTFRDTLGEARMKPGANARQMVDKLCRLEEEAEKPKPVKKPGILTRILYFGFGITLITGLIVVMKFLLGLLF